MTEFDPEQFRDLAAGLRRMHEPGIAVPPEVDRAILADVRASFVARRRKWAWAQRIGAGLAAAAVLAIAVRFFVPMGTHRPAMPAHSEVARVGDVNHDGKVNILDAFTVARAITRHEPLDRAWDVNGDGVVDQKDVDLLAHIAVRTSPEGPQ